MSKLSPDTPIGGAFLYLEELKYMAGDDEIQEVNEEEIIKELQRLFADAEMEVDVPQLLDDLEPFLRLLTRDMMKIGAQDLRAGHRIEETAITLTRSIWGEGFMVGIAMAKGLKGDLDKVTKLALERESRA